MSIYLDLPREKQTERCTDCRLKVSVKYKLLTDCSAGARNRQTDEEIDSSKNNLNHPSLGYVSAYPTGVLAS